MNKIAVLDFGGQYSPWNRNCAKCGKSVLTAFSPNRPEQICCEECYLKEVY